MSCVGSRTLIASLAAAVVAGCTAGNGAGLDQNGQPIGSTGGTPPLTADFTSIQDNVFTPICTRCHIGAGAPQGLQLDAAHSYSLLVGVPSAEQPNRLRVKAGDPDNSYIIRKLEGGPGIVGVQMPADGPPYLPQATINVIRSWITNGAMKAMAAARVSPSSQPVQRFAVAATSPESNSVVTIVLPAIVVAFNHELDAALVNYTTVTLEKADATLSADPMTSAGTSTQIPISTTLADGNPMVIVITPRVPLAAGTYRVTLRGAGGGALADVNAQALGSDYSFAFVVGAAP
jgi:methionine-rich copper-binding protein CopC